MPPDPPPPKKKFQIFKNLFFSHTFGEKIKCIIMISMKLITKIVKFMAPQSGVQTLGWSQYGYMVKCKSFSKIFFSTPIYILVFDI